jgi:signal transduction histidine kinase
MKRSGKSILRRVVLMQLASLIVFLAAASLLMHRAATRSGSGDFDRQMMFAADALAKLAEPDLDDDYKLRHAAQTIEELSREDARSFGPIASYEPVLQVWSAAGELLYRSEAAPAVPLASLRPGVVEAARGEEVWRVATARSPSGRLYVQVAESAEMRNEMLLVVFRRYFAPLLWGVPLLLCLTAVAAVRALRPLHALARQVEARSATALSRVEALPAYDETSAVADAINDLIERIEDTLARERAFLADAAHELRTPLAALETQAHVLVHAKSAQERAAVSEDMRGAMVRVAALLRQLLALSRLESEIGALSLQSIDFAALLQERVASFGRAALDKGIDLELDSPTACPAVLDREAMISLLDNLLDNAVRYVPHNGRVHVCLRVADDTLILQVLDDGPGVRPADRERIFDRFYRADGKDETGSGLGLAIAKQVAVLHGGDIRCTEGIGSGAGFELRLSVTRRCVGMAKAN